MLGGVRAVSQLPREHIMIASRISSAEQNQQVSAMRQIMHVGTDPIPCAPE
jgi:hypothetical protein